MQEVMLSLPVKANASLVAEEVAEIVQRLIGFGLAQSAAILEDANNCDSDDIEDAKLASSIEIGAPVAAKMPRVIVVVDGGVALPVFDGDVDAVIFDRDVYHDDPKSYGGVPSRFADLAIPRGIPVESGERKMGLIPAGDDLECPQCGRYFDMLEGDTEKAGDPCPSDDCPSHDHQSSIRDRNARQTSSK